ncbi:MAG: oxidoreductase [Alphaproteobacteria bacterium]|nr:oxidoreductase [Alphaproteobacteria bacterium]
MLSAPGGFSFRAGQHVDVRLTAPDGYTAQRSYSIASAPGPGDAIELMIEKMRDGEVSPFFHDVADVGDEIEVRGPIGGYFIWPEGQAQEATGPVVLVAGGSGLAPLISMVRHRALSGPRIPMALLFSVRTPEDVICADELATLQEARDGFELALAVTRGAAWRPGDFSRRIDADMAADVLARLPAAPVRAYVCGSNPFVEAAASALLASGLAADVIRTERYGG